MKKPLNFPISLKASQHFSSLYMEYLFVIQSENTLRLRMNHKTNASYKQDAAQELNLYKSDFIEKNLKHIKITSIKVYDKLP